KVGPGADEPPLLVIEMGEFDLQHTLTGGSTFTEDFKDQRRAVQHLGAGLTFEVTLLDRRQRSINEQKLDMLFLHLFSECFHMAGAEESRRPDFAHAEDLREYDVQPDGSS